MTIFVSNIFLIYAINTPCPLNSTGPGMQAAACICWLAGAGGATSPSFLLTKPMHVINTIEKHLHLRSTKLDILPWP